MSDNYVRLQNLRDFTVQIRHAGTDAIVGTGIVVSPNQIVTCAHVVVAAGVNSRLGQQIPGIWKSFFGRKSDPPADAEVGVYFPQARGGETKARRATVAACFPQHDDDVVLLQLVGGPAPLGPEQIAALGPADESDNHGFRSYGYRRLEQYVAGHAHGTIMGPVETPAGRIVHAEPVQLQSNQINRGMSGAAVLDIERNLIVGIVSETWYPDRTGKDRDTAWAVNAHVLTFDPFSFPLRDTPLDKRLAPQPKADIAEAQAAAAPSPGFAWNNAPPSLAEWVGRDELLKSVTKDWLDPNRRVTGLIGFGGEGKSSLARKWIDDLLSPLPSGEGPGVRGVFWWGFYEKPSVDEFFEAALRYMSGGRIGPRDYPSSNAKAHLIAGMLSAGRYIFVLDGLEVMQHQDGDEYGLLRSNDLREFLTYFAAPGHSSFCLITSRAPLIDLMAYTTYIHRDVDRLSQADGRALLRTLGVKGTEAELDKVVADWDGHALTLSLLGTYLRDARSSDVAHIDGIPAPTADEPRYERVHRVLRRYDEHLTSAERSFLTLFSAFRLPLNEEAFERVFRARINGDAFNAHIAVLDDAEFNPLIKRLTSYRILRHNSRTSQYSMHPLTRAHYLDRLMAGDHAQLRAVHRRIKSYYLALAGYVPHHPTLDDLAPLIEAVHHACSAEDYDEGWQIYVDRVDQGDRWVMSSELEAHETELSIVREFFPRGDMSQDPLVSDTRDQGWILNALGLSLMALGQLVVARPFYERSIAKLFAAGDFRWVSIVHQNLSELCFHLGMITDMFDMASQAISIASMASDKENERDSLACKGWAAHLNGNLDIAGLAFQQAEAVQREINSNRPYLVDMWGIWYADHLRDAGNPSLSRRVTNANLVICESEEWSGAISGCHRALADLDAEAGKHQSAHVHYDESVKIARSISERAVLVEALLARGRWYARHLKDASAAFSDLNEALGYAVQGGYRIYEADIRIGLAWAHLTPGPSPERRGEIEAARAEAEYAQRMSQEMGYHWGQVDAEEVLHRLKDEG